MEIKIICRGNENNECNTEMTLGDTFRSGTKGAVDIRYYQCRNCGSQLEIQIK